MKVITPWSKSAVRVYAISWLRHGKSTHPDDNTTSLSVLENNALSEAYESECVVVDANIDDFVMMPKSFDDRFLVLMWSPLADSGIWPELRDFDNVALKRFMDLLIEHGHVEVSKN